MGQSLRKPILAGESHQRFGVPLDGLSIPAACLEAGRLVVGIRQGKRMRQLVGQNHGLMESRQSLFGIDEQLEDIGRPGQAIDNRVYLGLEAMLLGVVEGEGLFEVSEGRRMLSHIIQDGLH